MTRTSDEGTDRQAGRTLARVSDGRRVARRTPIMLATIRDVAAEAGVSISTVSRALNDNGYVSDDVRQRVIGVAQRLAFQPSRRASSMRSLRTMMIGAIVPELLNPVNVEFLRGVETTANEHGYVVTMATSQNSPAREEEILRRLQAERVDAVIISNAVASGRTRQALIDNRIPVIPPVGSQGRALSKAWEDAETSVSRQVGERIVALGHRRVAIAFFAQKAGTRVRREMHRSRVVALEQALEAGGATPQRLILSADHDFSASAEAVAAAAVPRRRPTAWIASSHLVLPGLLAGLGSAGLNIPGDASVISYGDSEWARAFRPPITVIRRDIYAEARELTTRLLSAIDGHGFELSGMTYQPTLVERASLGPRPTQ